MACFSFSSRRNFSLRSARRHWQQQPSRTGYRRCKVYLPSKRKGTRYKEQNKIANFRWKISATMTARIPIRCSTLLHAVQSLMMGRRCSTMMMTICNENDVEMIWVVPYGSYAITNATHITRISSSLSTCAHQIAWYRTKRRTHFMYGRSIASSARHLFLFFIGLHWRFLTALPIDELSESTKKRWRRWRRHLSTYARHWQSRKHRRTQNIHSLMNRIWKEFVQEPTQHGATERTTT